MWIKSSWTSLFSRYPNLGRNHHTRDHALAVQAVNMVTTTVIDAAVDQDAALVHLAMTGIVIFIMIATPIATILPNAEPIANGPNPLKHA